MHSGTLSPLVIGVRRVYLAAQPPFFWPFFVICFDVNWAFLVVFGARFYARVLSWIRKCEVQFPSMHAAVSAKISNKPQL